MAMPAWVPEVWAELSEDDQKSVSEFMKLLLSRARTANKDGETLKPLRYGVFKGRITVPEDFDEPLPEFSDYM